MINIIVSNSNIIFAKKQIDNFKKIPQGKYRYTNVEAWRGIVCEILTTEWLSDKYNLPLKAKGLDDSGIYDEYDLLINGKKIEIKSATKHYFKYIMPKVYDVINKPKDIFICSRYNETKTPNEVEIVGWIKREDVLKYSIEQNKGAKYYKIPIKDLTKFG
tara:strand:+ start:740 stop:1219 length:480 start_codon:yes stop_codon:yes gene_type:complete